MKAVALLIVVAAGLLGSTGCATVAYSGHERAQLIARNWEFEGKQINDDIDSVLLLRPAGHLTLWHTR